VTDKDWDEEYARAVQPSRGGILSEENLRRIGKRLRSNLPHSVAQREADARRLYADTRAVRWSLHWIVSDLMSARSWGSRQAAEVVRLEQRVLCIFNLLTDEQVALLRAQDEERRAADG
jgi:hypothetical protein